MAEILIVYATTDGHTRAICERIQARLREHGHEARLVDIADADTADPSRFERVIVGASIRYGKHDPRVARFLERNADVLARLPNAFFSVNLTARKPDKRTPEGNTYVRKFLARLPMRPDHVEVFAGRLDYPSYGFLDRNMIRLIMKMTGGPTDPKTVVEYTDWEQVDAFVERTLSLPPGETAPVSPSGGR